MKTKKIFLLPVMILKFAATHAVSTDLSPYVCQNRHRPVKVKKNSDIQMHICFAKFLLKNTLDQIRKVELLTYFHQVSYMHSSHLYNCTAI